MQYAIVEIFYSIQGEGCNTGMPAVFVRLAGCNQTCSFCDTNHTMKEQLMEDEILDRCSTYKCKRVVITGGEPFMQNLEPLVDILTTMNYNIFIETNGTIAVPKKLTDKISWIAMSPKGAMRLSRWEEVKLIVSIDTNIESLVKQIGDLKTRVPQAMIFLQPCFIVGDPAGTDQNTQFTIQMVKELPGCYLSLQTHRMLNIR